jgi:serine/threonine-protein kinase
VTAPTKICPTCSAEYPAAERFCPQDGTALRTQGGPVGSLVGSVVAERYHVIRKLGEGGMGTVYLAEHVKMGRKSAVKVMNPGMGHDADAISRFNREAANASRINHPHVAGIYDFGETADGLIYLAMEYVEGEPLTDVVQAAGALPPMRAAEITRQAAEALTVAHELGIVHRDLKPDNIMIARNRDGTDCVKVVDFGIAKAAGSEGQKVTRTGLVVGTPEYMSPEQLAGDRLDGRSDIYSLALVAFHMLSGSTPFPSETSQESMIMRLTERPRSLADVKPGVGWTPAVQAVMDRALARDARLRFPTAREFGQALHAAVTAMPGSAEGAAGTLVMEADAPNVPPTRLSAADPVNRWRRAPILVGGAVAAALLIGGAVYAMREGPAAPAPVAERHFDSLAGNATVDVQIPIPPVVREPVPRETLFVRGGGPAAVASHGAELRTLLESVTDQASAARAQARVSAYRSAASSPADRAAVALVEAKAAMLTPGGYRRGCRLMRGIDTVALTEYMKKELADGLQSCENT